jgi:hypothetical protein
MSSNEGDVVLDPFVGGGAPVSYRKISLGIHTKDTLKS